MLLDRTDEELLTLTGEGDERAFEALVARLSPVVSTVVKSRQFHGDIQDTLQEVWAEVWQKASSYNASAGKAKAWLTTIAVRRTIDIGRKHQSREAAESRFEEGVGGADHWYDESETGMATLKELSSNERREELAILMRDLPEEQRGVILLALNGFSQREIAQSTNTPLGTVKTRMELALGKILLAKQKTEGKPPAEVKRLEPEKVIEKEIPTVQHYACPHCGIASDTSVIDSRWSAEHHGIRRRRRCANCKEAFTTIELIVTEGKVVTRGKPKRELTIPDWLVPEFTALLEKLKHASK